MSTVIQVAESVQEIEGVRELFKEYASRLDYDLCVQNFHEELASLPGKYASPHGCLYLARHAETIQQDHQMWLGCVGLRPLSLETGEIKRLYVRQAGRGQGLGRKLAETVLRQARVIGYRSIRLDTLPVMSEAIRLYETLGFRPIKPPAGAPQKGEIYFWIDL